MCNEKNKIKNKYRKIDESELEKATEHIFYETDMFFKTLLALYCEPSILTLKNLLLETFLIHTRNLYDFLYPSECFDDDDILVYDYIGKSDNYEDKKTPKKELKEYIYKINKKLSHLTYLRNTKDQFLYIEIGNKIQKTLIVFYDLLSQNFKENKNLKRLKIIIDNYYNNLNSITFLSRSDGFVDS
jgi:hypothetical protein